MITSTTPAPLGRRLAARFIDLALVTGVVAAGVAVSAGAVTTGDDKWAELGRFLVLLFVGMVTALVAVLTVVVVPTAIGGASAGKRLTGVRVVAVHGGRAGWGRSIVREAALPAAYAAVSFVLGALDWFPTDLFVLVGPGLLIVDVLFGCRPDGRTGHDLLAGTIVVPARPSGLPAPHQQPEADAHEQPHDASRPPPGAHEQAHDASGPLPGAHEQAHDASGPLPGAHERPTT
jgi:uncharacterized RDD family membrane protein YckC